MSLMHAALGSQNTVGSWVRLSFGGPLVTRWGRHRRGTGQSSNGLEREGLQQQGPARHGCHLLDAQQRVFEVVEQAENITRTKVPKRAGSSE